MSASILAALNEAQRRAVQVIDGPALVLAGPGSGKTRLLTHRIAYLIEEVGVDPRHILAVTFTNRAAREMRARLAELLGDGRASALTVGTFHGICARFLRRDIIHLGRERDFAIYDSDDQERLMKRVFQDLRIDEKKNSPRAILGTIGSAKNELVDVQEYARLNRTYYDEIVARCYEHYQALLRENNALDFGDLLFSTVRLFDLHPDVLAAYHQRYRYLLVDEYQDTNRAQYVLVRQLAERHRNLFAVGDDDQSIYTWRGADIRNILEFEKDYPDAQVFLLEQNYRSTRSILDVAQAIISGGTWRKHGKQLWTDNQQGLDVTLIEGYDQDDEAQQVADEIARLVASGDYTHGDCAVMYRTNAQSRAIEEALMGRGLPYHVVGGTRFYERKEVKDLLAYLRLIANPFDSVSLERIINTPKRGIGTRTVGELNRLAATLECPVYQALRAVEQGTPGAAGVFAARTRKPLLAFLGLIDQFIEAHAEADLLALFDLIVAQLEFREFLLGDYGTDEGEERWANVLELRKVAAEYAGLPREAQLPTFLEEVALVADVDTMDRQGNAVTCITLHQAKGLEYAAVFLVGLEEGLLPHSRSTGDRDKLEEERRLFYVGATRARERLYLLYAFRRNMFGRENYSGNLTTRSRFLKDIQAADPDMIRQVGKRATTSTPPPPRARPAERGRARPRMESLLDTGAEGTRFFPGQRVSHHMYGEGVVVSSRLVESDEEVRVNFGAQGEKVLLASFANLQHADAD